MSQEMVDRNCLLEYIAKVVDSLHVTWEPYGIPSGVEAAEHSATKGDQGNQRGRKSYLMGD